ncbi:MAG: replicative DNA helicase [Treponema sp.]
MADTGKQPASLLKDKIPPNNAEAEQAVLGAVLLESDAIGTVLQYIRTDSFYSFAHQKIFQAVTELYNKGQRIDLLVISDYLRQEGLLDSVGGTAYIASLTDTVPSTANVGYYAKVVQDAAIRRSLLKVSHQIFADVYNETVAYSSVLEQAQKNIFDLTDAGQSATFRTPKEIIPEAIETIEARSKHRDEFSGIPSGFEYLDTLTSGFQNAELIIIGARPSIGKTALALTIADHIAVTKKIPAAFFSLEMSDMQLMLRLFSLESRVSSSKIRSGNLQLADFGKIQDAAGRLYEAPLYIVDMPNMKLLDLRAMARQLCLQHGVKIIFIDYLGLITSENSTIPRHERFAEISQSLKSLARELNIPVIALSQVGRDAEGTAPTLANLRESGAIEQDADVVMFLHRAQRENPDTELIVAKQRNGPVATVNLEFISECTRFVSKERSN